MGTTMRRKKAIIGPLAMAASLSMTGCCYYELRDMWDECSINTRNYMASQMAWHEHKGGFLAHPFSKAYGHGFRDGYADVCGGGDGIAPNLPPRCYWKDCLVGGPGPERVGAYFEGFSQGAYVAQSSGLDASGRVIVSSPLAHDMSHLHSGMEYPMSGMPIDGEGYAGEGPLPYEGDGTFAVPVAPPVMGTPDPPLPSVTPDGPVIPANPAYESYNSNGIYYE